MNSLVSRTLVAAVVVAGGVALSAATDAASVSGRRECTSYRANVDYPLGLCDKGDAVKVLQYGLRVVEPNLTVDGYLGPKTHRAVLDFQQQFGLEVDGLVGPITWQAVTSSYVTGTDTDRNGRIDPAEATVGAPVEFPPRRAESCDRYRLNSTYPLRMCDRGPAVRVAQAFLSGWSPFSDLAVDGYFGPHTDQAVRAYQHDVGLEVDGLVGPQTWPRMTTGFSCGVDNDHDGVIDPDEITRDPTDFATTDQFREACGSPL